MAYDDAMNAATMIKITGGETYCLSTNNDGIDSNGDIKITTIGSQTGPGGGPWKQTH